MSTTSSIVNTLGAGSGIDIKALAQSLVDAERAPRKERLDTKISQSEAKISGYGALKSVLSDLKKAFEALNDASDLNSITVANSQPQAFAVTTTAKAAAATFSLQVSQVAQGQRSAGTFSSRSQPLNGGDPFWLKLTVAGAQASPIKVAAATPAGIVSAINGAKAGVSAQLIETGELNADGTSRAVVVLTGPEGAANNFSLEAVTNGAGDQPTNTGVSGLAPDAWVRQQDAQNAQFTLNGQALVRTSNQVSDAVDGVVFQLYTPTSGAARLELNRDASGIKDKVNALVTAYNEFEDSAKILGDASSEVETFGGALSGDSLLRTVRSQVRAALTGHSSTPGQRLGYAWQLGLSIDREGKLALDEARLDTALTSHFDDVVTLLTADTNNKSVYGTENAGLAGDLVRRIDRMLRSDGVIENQIDTTNQVLDRYKGELDKLQERMKTLLERYTAQFSAMDAIVSRSNSVRSSLENSLKGLMASSD